MIPNLVVLDPEHLLEGKPNPEGLIFASAIKIHPEFKLKMQHALMEMFDPESPPIFVSMDEAKRMMAFTRMIMQSDGAKKTFIENSYTQWWGEILKRALEEADEYKRCVKESKSEETPTAGL
jgi:hypothetical protein